MRKKNNSQYKPLSLKVLSRFGYIGNLSFIVIIIVLLVTDITQNSYLNDFISFSRLSLDTESQILEINYFSRMKQLSYYYPGVLNQFNAYSNNISVLGSQLQKNQFSLVQYALKAEGNGLSYKVNTLSWTINQNL